MDNRHMHQLKDNWEKLAQADAMWAVLTEQHAIDGGWDRQAFFRTGKEEVQKIFERIDLLGLQVRTERAFDFGCGLGRLTQGLGQRFDQVTGVDISNTMLAQAKNFAHQQAPKYSFVSNEDFFDGQKDLYDFGLSLITLQHVPPDDAKDYLRFFFDKLKPGGTLVFQLPAYPKGKEALFQWLRHSWLKNVHLTYLRLKQKWLKDDFLTKQMLMEMHGIARDKLSEYLEQIGYRIIEIKEDRSAGPYWQSYLYIVQK